MKYNNIVKLNLIALFVFQAGNAYSQSKAPYTLDVYGTSQITAERITADYQPEINQITDIMQHRSLSNSKKDQLILTKDGIKIKEGIKSNKNIAYVKISPVMYSHDPILHITVDVIDKKDKRRLGYFLPQPTQSVPEPHHLIKNWLAYEEKAFSMILFDRKFPTFKSCPAHHCSFGFEDTQLLKYKNKFDDAEKYKTTLVNILRNDKNESKRAAAVFVLAHIKDGNELVKLISPSIYDSSSLVRNNTMRVIGETVSKEKNIKMPATDIVAALDFPNTTDRNKALYVLVSLVDSQDNADYVKKHASQQLINILKLKQPNNHDPAYIILKKISGKNYGERDYQSWENWAKQS